MACVTQFFPRSKLIRRDLAGSAAQLAASRTASQAAARRRLRLPAGCVRVAPVPYRLPGQALGRLGAS